MSVADRRSALVVVATEAEPVVAEWRLRYHRHSVERRIPPHLTVLFPFVAQPQVRDELLHELGRLYAPLPSFTYDLVSVEAWDAFPMTHHVECIAVLEPRHESWQSRA